MFLASQTKSWDGETWEGQMQSCQMTAENFVLELSVAAEMLFIYSPRKENENTSDF